MFALDKNADKRRIVVLVVESDARVRLTIVAMLQAAGLEVVEAAAAHGVMEHLAEAPVDLVLSEIRLDGEMDGNGLASWLSANHPAVAVLLMSGGDLPREPDVPFIAKPFRRAQLKRRIAEVVSARKHSG